MISQRNNWLWFKINGLSRFLLMHWLSGRLPLYIVNEYPKSGGTWLGQMLSEAFEVPFPRNRLPMLRSSIMHGHLLWSGKMKNVIVLWRDGRDVLVSQYYYSLFEHDYHNAYGVELTRRNVPFTDFENIQKNLPAFIEYTYNWNLQPGFSWTDFYRSWGSRKDVVHVKYEDLRRDTPKELQKIYQKILGRQLSLVRAKEISEKYSFERQSGRKPGQENKKSFMRKGIVGDWENNFSDEAKKCFDRYAGDTLIGLGYEKDHAWVNL